ncbi:His Kinase A (phospho-acceptor) domain-containing protein [Bryocella elongata]|uniref:histidine kinase n=1 Tax=Bryocella elongata TaxID=863522 RepID=A0A1H5WI64_9BACT|nr:GAF domain-containing sensor histidine kinase [Bryocella elongata]SEF99033.1 His Kinase A (phospho-acceptor) domain-containing protein [Bryocella elongata]
MPHTTFAASNSLIEAPPPQYESLLSTTAHVLLMDADADTLCQRVFEAIRGPLQLDVYFHYLVSEDGTQLELASSGGNQTVRDALGTTLQFGEAICGTVAQTCLPMTATHVLSSNDPKTFLIRTFGIRCYSCKPLIIQGRIAGTLSFGSTHRDEFTSDENDLFGLIAKQVTIATERRMQNARLREMERLATLGRMSATLAHEINNPLETLNNILFLLRGSAADAESAEMLTRAEEQVERLAEISRRTLELFRGQKQVPQSVNLSQLVDELAANLHLPAHTRLVTSLEDSLIVSLVPGEMRQVLFNLILNAAHFSPEGQPVTLTLRQSSGFAEVRIRDEGMGISEETRRHLFEPFYTTRAEGGTGVGLWISREMVERAEGTLTFESNPDVRPGTEFIIRLPLAN